MGDLWGDKTTGRDQRVMAMERFADTSFIHWLIAWLVGVLFWWLF